MPCFDGGPTLGEQLRQSEWKERVARKRAEAMLCAIVRVLESNGTLEDTLNRVDENRAGLAADSIRAWWLAHKMQDGK